MTTEPPIPLWLKIASTLFVAVLIPAYWGYYGPSNFLWFSDIALFGMVLALWWPRPLLPSMMLIGVLLPEAVWNIEFLTGLVLGSTPLGLADYMFEAERPLLIRGLSLFHIPMPVILIYLVYTLGYDRRALVAQTLLVWIVQLLTYQLSDPSANINWVFSATGEPHTGLSPELHLAAMMIAYPLLIVLPTHLLVTRTMQRLGRPIHGQFWPVPSQPHENTPAKST